jgi:hypothetical protein
LPISSELLIIFHRERKFDVIKNNDFRENYSKTTSTKSGGNILEKQKIEK